MTQLKTAKAGGRWLWEWRSQEQVCFVSSCDKNEGWGLLQNSMLIKRSFYSKKDTVVRSLTTLFVLTSHYWSLNQTFLNFCQTQTIWILRRFLVKWVNGKEKAATYLHFLCFLLSTILFEWALNSWSVSSLAYMRHSNSWINNPGKINLNLKNIIKKYKVQLNLWQLLLSVAP